jgi:hypothetical protein
VSAPLGVGANSNSTKPRHPVVNVDANYADRLTFVHQQFRMVVGRRLVWMILVVDAEQPTRFPPVRFRGA